MSNIIELPLREMPLYEWRCSCGCRSFSIRSDGTIQCCYCDEVTGPDEGPSAGRWLAESVPPEDEPERTGDEPPRHSVVQLGEASAARRSMLRRIESADTLFICAIERGGRVHTLGAVETVEEAAWLRGLLDVALQHVTRHLHQGPEP